ncbi:hypothetical protein RLOatenuis_1980 [Rickettsiales bacterium]|nr:hypothetical protein RLOatenuis_1980 [Rickettsiales bacterium]
MRNQNDELYRSGVISKKTYKEQQQEEAKRQEQCGSCLLQGARAAVCIPCADLCYNPQEKKRERNLAASLQATGFYGIITTILGATATKSTAAVAFGATTTAVSGTIATIWCCIAKRRDGCSAPDSDAAQQNASHAPANPGAFIITTQPKRDNPETTLGDIERDPYDLSHSSREGNYIL